METVRLPSGKKVPVLGQGTWKMGENPSKKDQEVRALKLGLELGMTLIDTAEIYGNGGAEEVTAEAIRGRRQDVVLVSKVAPGNATLHGVIAACEKSLKRLNTDYLDIYLLHWRGSVPLEETLLAFQQLKKEGKILDYGVSNFDTNDMEEARALPGGDEIATNQVLYNLVRRGIEWDLLPWCSKHTIPIMAYSPFMEGDMLHHNSPKQGVLKAVAARHAATPAQIALAWLLRQSKHIVIPKSSNELHVRENHASLKIKLTEQDLKELDHAFSPPHTKSALDMV